MNEILSNSAQLGNYDTRPGKVETFVPSLYPNATIELNEYICSIKNNDKHELLENYTDLNFFDFPFVTVIKQNNNIAGFSTGYTRDMYPHQCIRILNRYYHDPQINRVTNRPNLKEWVRPTTLAMIEQQLEMCRRLDFDTAIITREKTKRQFTKFINEVSNKSSQTWELSNNLCLVTPSYNNSKAWQTVAYTKFRNINYDFWEQWQTK